MGSADEIAINFLREQIKLMTEQLNATNECILLNLNPAQGPQLERSARNLAAKLREVEQELVARYTAQQQSNIQLVLAAVEQGKIAPVEAQQLTMALRETIDAVDAAGKLEHSNLSEPTRQAKEIFDDSKIDFKHKLKAGIPIIPGLLTYEVELGVGSGLSLTALWENLVHKFRRGPASPDSI